MVFNQTSIDFIDYVIKHLKVEVTAEYNPLMYVVNDIWIWRDRYAQAGYAAHMIELEGIVPSVI